MNKLLFAVVTSAIVGGSLSAFAADEMKHDSKDRM